MKVLGVIPVRGGSKGVPKKNIRELGGQPLLAYTVAAAKASALSRVVLSTEDEEIAALAESLGVEVLPRPKELAEDTTPTLPVIQHALAAVEKTDGPYDYVFTLQATAPLRTATDIDAAIELARTERPESVIGVVRVFDTHPARIKRVEKGRLADYFPEDEFARRQDLPPAYLRNGAVYLSRRDVIEKGSLRGCDQLPYEMPPERSVNIDEPIDFLVAEELLRNAQYTSRQ